MTNGTFSPRRETSLAAAWSNAFLEISKRPNREIAPFAVTVDFPTGLAPADVLTHPLVNTLDACLLNDGHQTVEQVAFTIFPERIWRLCGGDRQEFYKEAMLSLRTLVAWDPRKNRCGVYFARLIGFGVDHRTGQTVGTSMTKALGSDGNQLEHVIRQCRKSVERGRRVARMQLQAALFDPFRDLTTSGQPSFPCMQHVVFDPDIEAKTLSISAFYATQQLYVKAFGNWLGLCRLGAFIAGQADLTLGRFTCFVGTEKMDKSPKAGPLRSQLVQAAREFSVPAPNLAAVARHA